MAANERTRLLDGQVDRSRHDGGSITQNTPDGGRLQRQPTNTSGHAATPSYSDEESGTQYSSDEQRSDETAQSPRKFSAVTIIAALFGIFCVESSEIIVIAIFGRISSEFQELSHGQWLLIGYVLGYCVALPIYGRMGDMYGPKKPILVAYLLYGLGSAIAGLSATFWQVIVGRTIAGIGGSGIVAMISVVITDNANFGEVAIMRSYVNLAVMLGWASGGPIGGILADSIGWRWSFGSQAPIALILSMLAGFNMPSQTAHQRMQMNSASKDISRLRDIDFLGIITFAIFMCTLLVSIDIDGQILPWNHPTVICLLVICLLSGACFLWAESRASKPLVPLWLLRTGGLGFQCLVQILIFTGTFAYLSNLAPYFVRTEGFSTTEAGIFLVPSSLGNGLGALAGGRIMGRTYRYKALSMIALAIGMASYMLILFRWRYGTNIWESMYSFSVAISVGLLLTTTFIGTTAGAPKSEMATAISMYYLCQQIGTTVGTALAAAVLRTEFRASLEEKLAPLAHNLRERIIKHVLDDHSYTAKLSEELQGIVRESFLEGFKWVPLIGDIAYSWRVFTLVMAIISYIVVTPILLMLRERSLK